MKKTRHNCGFTIIETLIAVVILLIVLAGTSQLRYFSILDSKKATRQVNAARVALLLNESWRGTQGSASFDPLTNLSEELTIQTSEGPAEPNNFILLGKYAIEINNENYYATMSYRDIASGLRAINTSIAWDQNPDENNLLSDADKLFELTTYTLN